MKFTTDPEFKIDSRERKLGTLRQRSYNNNNNKGGRRKKEGEIEKTHQNKQKVWFLSKGVISKLKIGVKKIEGSVTTAVVGLLPGWSGRGEAVPFFLLP